MHLIQLATAGGRVHLHVPVRASELGPGVVGS